MSSQFTSYGIARITIIVMRAIQGLFPIIPFSYILSLLFYPSLVSYSYFWMIDFLCKVCSWKPVYRTTILTLMTPWKSAKYNSSEQAEVEATVNQWLLSSLKMDLSRSDFCLRNSGAWTGGLPGLLGLPAPWQVAPAASIGKDSAAKCSDCTTNHQVWTDCWSKWCKVWSKFSSS